jgi:antagonist of KipI
MRRRFFGAEFQIGVSSNRMGYYLHGPELVVSPPEVISEPLPKGAIQILPNGQLILLMADHQTVGGYPKIAVLASADLPKAAQLGPGHRVKFAEITLKEAHHALAAQEQKVLNGVVRC